MLIIKSIKQYYMSSCSSVLLMGGIYEVGLEMASGGMIL
jgi:hypothetical protein